jgi:hypothetical protein
MYGKLFSSMYEGTLYGQWQAIITLQQLVILADADGVVDMTPPAIAARTSIPLDIIEAGLTQLAEVDKYSRTPTEDGRRIVLIDEDRPWGWRIVNYAYYRDLASREDKKAKDRERIAAKRLNSQDVAECRNVSQSVADVAHTDTDTDIDKKKRGTRKRATPPPKSFEITDGHREWGKANAPRVDLAAETAKFLDYHTAKGNSLKDWGAAWRNWMRKAVEFKAERAGPEPPPDALPRGHPPHIHPDQYATLDDESKRRAWEAWQTILEKRRQGDAVSTQ